MRWMDSLRSATVVSAPFPNEQDDASSVNGNYVLLLDIQEAVNAPRFHHQWLPDQILVEDRLSPDTMNLLRSKGHKLNVEHFWGDGECIMIDPKTGERLGASDGRKNGKAVSDRCCRRFRPTSM